MIKYLLLLTVLLAGGYSSPIKVEEAPSCQACHSVDPDKINVHLIPHSHDDVGWLKTFDQYYFGNHKEITNEGVQYIISSTVEALKADPDRRYVQVETAFFWKWWQRQPDSIREEFVELVNNGQLEIINAAWSMNDEAGTNYQSTIDQFTYGLRTINETIGACGTPRIGWQIDPFGHSREQASIFARLGYDGVFFARIDYKDRDARKENQDMEVIWQGSASLDNADIFTNVFPEFYYPPDGYCFDIDCSDEVLVDDETSPDYNIPRKVEDFKNHVIDLAQWYRTNNLLIPMGGDFQYQSAEKNFVNTDKLIAGFQDDDQVNVIYSTPSCYIQAVNDAAAANNVQFTRKVDDFFPYGSDAHSYWTGYFTSRPNAKRFERTSNNILQAAKQLASFSKANGEDHANDLKFLQEALGVLQHHDAITGTAKEAVANDYARLLAKGISKVEPAAAEIITNLLKKDATTDINLNLQTCLLANVSICEPTNSGQFVVTVYNPLERPVTHYVRLPVADGAYTVTGPDGDVTVDLVDSISSFSYVDDSFGSPKSKELVFAASDVPGFGIKLYYVQQTAKKSSPVKAPPKPRFGTDTTGFEIDDDTGLLKTVTLNGQTLDITQEILYYNGHTGDNNGAGNRASGAYIFRPQENDASPVGDSVTVTSFSGAVVDEVRQEFSDWVTQVIRVYKGGDDNYIEFDWLVGPIPDSGNSVGREVITRFTVNDFDSAETFYTDSNGRELIQRTLNKRYDYEYDSSIEPVASNYYPVTSKIVIKDESKNLEVAVLNDRAQGGSSLQNGVVELMVHRRLFNDDNFGVAEALDDEEFGQGVVARGQNYLIVGSTASGVEGGKSTAAQERELALKKLLTPLVLVGDASSSDLSLANIQNALNFNFEGLKTTLPDNVHILTLEPWQEDAYILRLEHILESNEDDTLSQSVDVDLEGLFTLFDITEIRETTLGANQWLDEFEAKEKYVWQLKDGTSSVYKKSTNSLQAGELLVTLGPMQIRTFIIKVSTTK